MLEFLFELLAEEGYKQTFLSVQKENPAVRLYQRMGYETVRENEEDYIMDIDDRELAVAVIAALEPVTAVPKPKKKKPKV